MHPMSPLQSWATMGIVIAFPVLCIAISILRRRPR